MRFQENFKFLKADIIKRKKTEEENRIEEENKTEREFLVLHLLDNENNPCSFFVFSKDLIEKVKTNNYIGLQDVLILFELTFTKSWTVRLLDID